MVPLKIVISFSRFNPALNLNRFDADLRRGSNSFNSDSGLVIEHGTIGFKNEGSTKTYMLRMMPNLSNSSIREKWEIVKELSLCHKL